MPENQAVNDLIALFNSTFAHKHTVLVRSKGEPEYFPATYVGDNLIQPARIAFAHGFFASALHEISHWCIAGKQRRTLPDFGYWYAPDGRDASQQVAFEKVEIKPQALEWLFTLACQRRFSVSLDNLEGEAGSGENFKDNVFALATAFLQGEESLPPDAKLWLNTLIKTYRPNQPIQLAELSRNTL